MIKIPKHHIEGALFYVTSRGDHNEDIFRDEGDYKQYLELLKKYKEQYGFKLFAFCLMPNHLHLLIELKEGITISDIMHDLNSNYTKYFNGKYQKKGHLFQERYKMVLVEKESYLLYLTAYIHLNPKVLGLVSDLKDYPYSSYLYYVNRGTEELKNQRTEELDLGEELGDEVRQAISLLSKASASRPEVTNYSSYENFLNSIAKEEMEILGKELTKKNILGSDDFLEKIEVKIEMERLKKKEKPQIHRRFVLAGSLVILVLMALSFGLYTRTLAIRENLKKALEKKETELSGRLVQEREKVHKDLDEKYRADKVSYQAMSKRLEIEKKKIRELEERIK